MAGQTRSETGPLDAPVLDHFYGGKRRLKALSEGEGRLCCRDMADAVAVDLVDKGLE